MKTLLLEHALLPDGWAADVRVTVAEDGTISSVCKDPTTGDKATGDKAKGDEAVLPGVSVPGMANLHSHAFQRGMAGLAEVAGAGSDSFWTWREVMYHFVDRLRPEDLEAIAALLYIEMLESGFTAVGEFHYLHHAPNGDAYQDLGEMSARIAAAAADSGIALTLLPVFYNAGGFGAKPVAGGQRRFFNDSEGYLRLVERAGVLVSGLRHALVGIAPHSLRAVPPEALAQVLEATPANPVHIHISEQTKEVEDCLAWLGSRPVEWLYDNAAVDPRWCLVHATHIDSAEREAIARSGAVVGLCPITEANLGDGIFPADTYLQSDGRIGIGSDSNVWISLPEELRTLEYSQRLRDRRRNVLADSGQATARRLFDASVRGGAQALGQPMGSIAPGHRADIVVLDRRHPAMVGRHGDQWLNAWIFAGDNRVVKEVRIGGEKVVQDGRHRHRDRVQARYVERLGRLLDS